MIKLDPIYSISGSGRRWFVFFGPTKYIDSLCLFICFYIMVSVRSAWAHWHFMFLRVILCSSCRWWSSWSLFSVVWLFHSYWWSRTSLPSPSTEEWHRKRGVCVCVLHWLLTHETWDSQTFVSPKPFNHLCFQFNTTFVCSQFSVDKWSCNFFYFFKNV